MTDLDELRWDLDHAAPPHVSRVVVGPIVHFRRQPVAVTSSPPRDTCDPRYDRCVDHRLACDCREAELGETITEMRGAIHEYEAERKRLRELLGTRIAGHPTVVTRLYGLASTERLYDRECACPLCAFARDADLVPYGNKRRSG